MEKKSCGCAARTKEKFNAGLKKDARAIVENVEGYSKEDRTRKAAEVKAAFPAKTAAGRSTAKVASAGRSTAKVASAGRSTAKTAGAAKKSTTKAATVGRSGAKTVSKAAAKPAVGKSASAKKSTSAKSTGAKSVAKSTAKTASASKRMPTPAGMSKGSHSGDMC